MLKKAQEWKFDHNRPGHQTGGRVWPGQLIEAWMEQKLLTVTAGERLTPQGREVARGLGAVSHDPADHAG